ncbi:MAG: methylmalonyl-CoA epimerase [Anaerolineales bacterium]
MATINKIHHIAIVVENMDEALTFWRDTLGITNSGVQDISQESAQVAFLPLGDSEIELIIPTSTDSGLAKFLAKRGAGMHHLCLEVDDLDAFLFQLQQKNVRLINELPRVNQEGRRYIFIHPESTNGVLVELYEKIS